MTHLPQARHASCLLVVKWGLCFDHQELNIILISLPVSLRLSSLGTWKGFSLAENFVSWPGVMSPVLQRLAATLSRCWLSLITCNITSKRVLLSFCLTSLLFMHWPEVISRKKIVNSMCHFLSTCMASLSGNTSVCLIRKIYMYVYLKSSINTQESRNVIFGSSWDEYTWAQNDVKAVLHETGKVDSMNYITQQAHTVKTNKQNNKVIFFLKKKSKEKTLHLPVV